MYKYMQQIIQVKKCLQINDRCGCAIMICIIYWKYGAIYYLLLTERDFKQNLQLHLY